MRLNMSPSAREYLQNILQETNYIITHSVGLDKAVFLQNETLKRAYVRSLEIIDEAVKQLPDSLRQKYNAIEWRAIASFTITLVSITIWFGMLWRTKFPNSMQR